MTARPAVSVIVPFAGSADALEHLIVRLAALDRRDGDEVLIADNRPDAARRAGNAGGGGPRGVRVLPAAGARAPGFARNRGAQAAAGAWLIFLDADTLPPPDLLDRYFAPPPRPGTAVLAGAIVDRPGRETPAARLSAERGQMSQRVTLGRAGRPYAQTANCAVRREAFAAVGGFDEAARAGEDADLCFRLADAGWGLEERAGAAVEHVTRATLPALLEQLANHGRGAAWLERRYPGEFPAPRPGELAGRLGHAGRAALSAAASRDRERIWIALLELVSGAAFDIGRLLPNRPRRR